MRRTILLFAIAACSVLAVPALANAQPVSEVPLADAQAFTEDFVTANASDLVRGTRVQRVRALGCIDTSTIDGDSAECAFIATLQRARPTTSPCDTGCDTGLTGRATRKAPVRSSARRWVCIGVVTVTPPIDEADDFEGEFAFDDCVRVRTRTTIRSGV